MRSTDDDANLVLAHVLTNVLGRERIIDARPRLARKGHPEAKPERPPIWAASHERATVERVLRSAIGSPCPPAPDQPERILDRRTVYRWLATEEHDSGEGTTAERGRGNADRGTRLALG